MTDTQLTLNLRRVTVRDLSNIRGDLTGIVRGNLSDVRGNLRDVRGDLSGVRGDLTDYID